MLKRKRHKMNRKQRRIRSRVTLRTIILLIITLIANTYAWFLYVTTVSVNLTAHVDAWHVEFEVNNNSVQNQVQFQVDHAYPGMQTITKVVKVTNSGEKQADLEYEYRYFRVFNDWFVTQKALDEGEQVPQNATVLTQQQMQTRLQSNYPFCFSVQKNKSLLNVGEYANVTLTFSWDYETQQGAAQKDTLDTSYGVMARQYYLSNPNTPAIQIVINISAKQHRTQP